MATADDIAERVRAALTYDPETGIFLRRGTRCGRWKDGTAIGHGDDNGYVRIRFEGKMWRAHRLAWLYVHGTLPEFPIDHVNGNRRDNRIVNLRAATVRVNNENIRSAKATSIVGLLGVSPGRRGGFTATIKTELAGHTVQLYLGLYESEAVAHAVYLDAKAKLHAGYSAGGINAS